MSQLFPLELNPATGEPFLRLREHRNVILTPPRLTDAPHLPRIFNDDRVCAWLLNPPFPYLPEHAEEWLTGTTATANAVLAQLNEANKSDAVRMVKHSPVKTLREVQDDGTDVFLGDIDIVPCNYGELMGEGVNWEEKERREKENASREPGDVETIWSVGYYLDPNFQGRGIMSDALATLLHEWAIPRMGVRHMIATALEGNEGSVKVLEKNGFTLTRTLKDHNEAKGKKRTAHVLEWNL